jgi:hypothetical protein
MNFIYAIVGKYHQNPLRFFIGSLFLLGLLVNTFNDAFSLANHNWSPQQRVAGLGENVSTPFLVADSNRTVHAFVSDWVGSTNPQLAVVYLQWTREGSWTNPVDIILPQRGQARVKGAFLDDSGVMHLIFFGGDDISGGIFYSRAQTLEAGKARAWSQPIEVGFMAITPEEAVLIGDGNGNLFIIYAGNLEERGLYSIVSNDGGDTWTEPVQIYATDNEYLWPSSLDANIDQLRRLHLAWTVRTTNRVYNEGVFYSKMDTANLQWGEPIILEDLSDGNLAWSISIIEHQSELLAIYHDDEPTTRFMRSSRDGGETWSQPMRLFEQVGSNGAASLVVDGNGVMHMFFGNRIGWPSIHGMWHSTWDGLRWGIPTPIVSGPRVVDRSGASGFDPSFARGVVSQGNTILVTWRTDPGAGPNGLWYSYTKIDAHETLITPLPTTALAEVLINQTPTPTFDQTPESLNYDQLLATEHYFLDNTNTEKSSNPNTALVGSLIPVLLFVFAAVGYYRYRKHF